MATCVNQEVRADMWKFIRTYAIYPSITTNMTIISQERFYFERNDFGITSVKQTTGNDFVSFYYLPWQDDQCITGQIPKGGANYFFTGPLNGCTFAVDKNWYNPTVGHANYNNPTTQSIDHVRMRQDINTSMAHCTSSLSWLWSSTAPNITVLESYNRKNTWGGPNNTRDVNYNVFGYRGTFGWSFMYQVVDRYDSRKPLIAAITIST